MLFRVSFTVLTALLILWAASIKAEEKKAYPSYWELGVGQSLLIEPIVGYRWGRVGVRFAGMYLTEDNHEYYFNLNYLLSDVDNVQRSINLVTKRVVGSDPGADYRFTSTGVVYGINYNGFFFEIGLSHPWQDELGNLANDPLLPSLYWGYIHRFRSL